VHDRRVVVSRSHVQSLADLGPPDPLLVSVDRPALDDGFNRRDMFVHVAALCRRPQN
jgi:hypothetical protein